MKRKADPVLPRSATIGLEPSPDLGAGGRRLESGRPDHFFNHLVQWLCKERQPAAGHLRARRELVFETRRQAGTNGWFEVR
jgi:hypothetical protein